MNFKYNYIIGFFILFLYTSNSFAQLINNRIDFSLQASHGKFMGNKVAIDGDFSFPAFYPGLSKVRSISTEIIYNSGSYISFGAGLARVYASDWSNSSCVEFYNSRLSINAIHVLVQLHTAYHKAGFLNRGKLFMDIAPILGVSQIMLEKDLMEVEQNETLLFGPKEVTERFFGARIRLGGNWSISQSLAINTSCSYQMCPVNSVITNDSRFSLLQVSAGIVFRFKPDKRFNY